MRDFGRFIFKTVLCLVLFFTLIISASSFEFNGTILDINGNPLNNSLINITLRNSNFSINGYNTTTSNASGWFNISVTNITNGFYELRITWTNSSTNAIEFTGQSLPSFPAQIFTDIAGTTFYLREAGSINITAINSSGDRIPFRYQIKDQKLGYSIAQNFESNINESLIVVPRDRNYSIMIYPDQSMPVSFNWNNFSTTSSYTINSLSNYNYTLKLLNYRFNTTMNFVRVTGYINYTTLTWNEFTVVPYLLEPGNIVHSDFGDMPYNMSSIVNQSDTYNVTNGFYNITVPSTPAETSSMLLFATARNGSNYYGGFRNITSVGSGLNNFNFTSMYVLLGSASNITMTTVNGTAVNVSAAKQSFNIVNSSNSTLTNINAHVEATLNYSDYQAIEFTWMIDSQQGTASTFSIPLLNSTGIKEMNVFVSGGGDFAPKRKSYTLSDIQTVQNITVSSFNPADIDGQNLTGGISIALLISNSTCDVPNPEIGCFIGGNSSGQGFGVEGGFNPMKAVIGGGKLSFRMGLLSSGITIHYVNVDMMASGPPDALFDDSTSTSTTSGYNATMRFGSLGPTIYDFVLVSIPYNDTAGSGLDDSGNVNVSIPLLYDDNWNVIWNVSRNGTNAEALAANYSHYSTYQSDWGYLLNQSVCATNQNNLNVTNPCFISAANNTIWIRLPHFSGAGPSASGAGATASGGGGGSSGRGGSSGGGTGGYGGALQGSPNRVTLSPPSTSGVSIPQSLRLTESTTIVFSITTSSMSSTQDHSIALNDLISASSAKFTSAGRTPQTFDLNVGGEKSIDLDDDGISDLRLALDFINWQSKYAVIEVEIITSGISISLGAEDELETSSDTSAKDDEITKNFSDKEKQEVELEDSKSKNYSWIMLLLALVFCALMLYKKRYGKNYD